MLDKINSILRFDLCPLRPTNQGNDYYEPQFRQLSVVDENFDALFRINFTAPVFSSKVKYYKRLIDNVISEELNSLFEESADNIILFKRKKLSKCVDDYLFVIKDIIIKYNLDLDIIFSVRDFSKNQSQNEKDSYLYHGSAGMRKYSPGTDVEGRTDQVYPQMLCRSQEEGGRQRQER